MDQNEYISVSSQIRAQLDEIDAVFDLVEERASETGPAGIESLGYQLHNLYSACEDLFEIVTESFENHLDNGGGYHIEILKRMKIEITGVRPRAISEATFNLLDSLRGFRHVFRHAYGTSLDRRKIDIVLEDARLLRKSLRREFAAFLESLKPR
jgi:hypothetical protein